MKELYLYLRAIQARDPDGGTVKPTDADHAAHEAWAVAEYGREVWDTYVAGNWAKLGRTGDTV
jgi:hypothetical protein